MKTPWTDEIKAHIREYTVSGILIALVCFALVHFSEITAFLANIWKSMAPFIWGFCIAFVLVPLQRLVENKWLSYWEIKPGAKRALSVTFSLIIFILIITMFFMILIPQLAASFETLAASMDGYMTSVQNLLNQLGQNEQLGQLDRVLMSIYEVVRENLTSWVSGSAGVVSRLLSYSVLIVKGVFNFLVGIIIAVYLLLDKERWIGQLKKAAYAFLSIEHTETLIHVCNLTARMLDSFIFGKALDSLIIGIAAAVCCGLMNIPYTPLIAFIVGITNMIPVFGPFIGAVPCAFILLIISPAKAFEFIIFILILQQIDGNILGPYILGDSLGLPPVWVMFAIIVGGALWGVLGMFLGVPVFSVIYVLMRDLINRHLKEKRIKVN